MKAWYNNLSMKIRLMILYIVGPIILFVGISILSYFTIRSIYTNRIETSIMSDLSQSITSIDDSIDTLTWVSQQLASASASQDLDRYMDNNPDPYLQSELVSRIMREISTLSFSNPKLVTINYITYEDSASLDFSSAPLKSNFLVADLQQIARKNQFTFYGPHLTYSRLSDKTVISVIRRLNGSNTEQIAAYVEIAFDLATDENAYDRSADSYVIYNAAGQVLFSKLESDELASSDFTLLNKGSSGVFKSYKWHSQKSDYGYTLVHFVPERIYNKEIRRWLSVIALICFSFCCFTILFVLVVKTAVFSPMRRFNNEIKEIQQGNLTPACEKIGIPEFDVLLAELSTMKIKVQALINEAELHEKLNSKREIEALIYQINPHFLMNTLNTVHWLALQNQQREIDHVVMSLNKLLYYNLKRDNRTSTVRDEIEASKQYVALQQVLYDFTFHVHMENEEDVLSIPMPRFILQPLIENAICHGIKEAGSIELEILRRDERLIISVRDDGCGMPEKVFRTLNENLIYNNRSEMGIGLSYVNRMIKSRYGERANLTISSTMDVGTTVILVVPIQEEGDV